MTSTQVSATIAEYGSYTRISSLFELTSIDEGLKEHTEVHGYNAGYTIDTLIAAELSANATVQLAGAKTNITAIAATDTLTGAELRKARRTLMTNKALTFPGGYFRLLVQPYQTYDLNKTGSSYRNIVEKWCKFRETLLETILSEAQKWERATTIITCLNPSWIWQKDSLFYMATYRGWLR